MATVSEFIKKAYSQIGVKESPANSNNVKYNTDYYGHNVYGGSYAWCAVFLWWCASKVGHKYPKNANCAYCQDDITKPAYGGKWIMKKNKSRATRKAYLGNAKKGDIVCFDFGAFDAYRRHTGTVYSRQGDHIWCIEGNTSIAGSQSNGGRVCLKKRHYTDICSAVRPKWVAEPVKPKKAKKVKQNKKVYVNIGHSKTDSGAVSKYGVERKFNEQVAKYMIAYLKAKGISVKSNPPEVGDLKKITDEANKWGADLYVSIHFNSGGGDGWEGLMYNLDAKHKACGKIFEKHIKAVGQNSRGLKARPDLKNLRLTDMMAILNEIAFIDKKKDIMDWNEKAEFKKMGEALAKASIEYLNK